MILSNRVELNQDLSLGRLGFFPYIGAFLDSVTVMVPKERGANTLVG
jgi:hypothetical protein